MIGTFRIIRTPQGYVAIDRCTFNPWPDSEPFTTRDACEDYAMRCHLFKIGRRMTV